MIQGANSFDWNHMRAFLATAEEGSLSAAARKLGLTQPTLGRQVTALEAELNLMLFERVGRNLVLTQAGEELLQHVAKRKHGFLFVNLKAPPDEMFQ
ncbi:MAG: LysR family transcriptional regulator, partial [Pseudomonadota bacterium]|nr:LysR family transcriptional regulator [Pseudomonadota bacterium]